MSSKSETALVCSDRQRHTCIEVARQAGLVKYIPLNIAGMELLEMNSSEFDRTYSPLNDYPVEKAAQLYVEYAAQLGGTKEAMQALATFVPLTPREIEMATTKKAASAAAKTETAAKAKVVKPAAKTAVTKETKAPAAKKEAGEKKQSASSMFKDLIMQGKFTDDQIFAKVQKEFDLEDNKRSYVKWYRNDLIKKGEKPPAAKG